MTSILRTIPLLPAMLVLVIPAFAGDQMVIADFSKAAVGSGVPEGWQLKEKSGKAHIGLVQDEGMHAVRMTSLNSSFSLQKEVGVDLKRYPVMRWKWKVTRLPEGGDFRQAETDDQAAQIFLAFSKTRAIVYLWDTSAPQGTTGDAAAPFFMAIKAVVVRSGQAGTARWITETRNVYEDYKRFFHEEPDPVAGVRLQINSQHTGTEAECFFGDVSFQKQ